MIFSEQKMTKLDFIKCDVEGAELTIYTGGINVIREHKAIIFTEMLRKWSVKFNYHPNDIIALLFR
ncbi:FkbM family methyltransferase [Rickettsiella endosymbiont of Rhagonycha lignosa]|uniref:FkbM family methyltransferase n=1 Tax=Rickettsiella endosymbiont of Rhagonycha lignosa TaxID=3077937 RepID=UPI00313AF8DD